MAMGRKTVRRSAIITLAVMLIFWSDPPDNLLRGSLEQYARERLSRAQKLARLGIEHDLYIGYDAHCFIINPRANLFRRKSKLNELERKFRVMSVRKPPPLQVATQAVITEVLKNPAQTNGPSYIKDTLKDKGLAIPRYVV